MDNKAPCTPCSSRDLLGSLNRRISKMTLQEQEARQLSVANAIDAALKIVADGPLGEEHEDVDAPPQHVNADDELGFQTPPAALRRRKLSFVVTPPKLKEDEAAAASNDEPLKDTSSSRKRVRQQPPPMLPGSPEFEALQHNSSTSHTTTAGAFQRHIPIHSPIAGLTSVVNAEFLAKLLMEEEAQEQQQQVEVDPRCVPMRPRDSFLAKHAFPILEEEDVRVEAANDDAMEEQQQPAEGLSMPSRALKMRKRCRDDDLWNEGGGGLLL